MLKPLLNIFFNSWYTNRPLEFLETVEKFDRSALVDLNL